MKISTIHLEHALPALAELGIETLVPLLGGQSLTPESLHTALEGLAGGAKRQAIRQIVAIAQASGEELLAWEDGGADARKRALTAAALANVEEAKQTVLDFFSSLGPFLPSTHASSAQPGGVVEGAQETVSAPGPSADS